MKSKPKCLLCQTDLSGPMLELGKLPPCNNFVPQPEFSTTPYPLTLSECPSCALIQLIDPPPVEALTPRVPWIRYNEPDGHLDSVSSQLREHLRSPAPIYGVGPFDQPLLNKLTAQDHRCETLDLLAAEHRNRIDSYPYLETLQGCLQLSSMQRLAQVKGRAQLVVCRYLLEHCRDPLAALASFRPLLAEDGLALIEVPDSSKFLSRKDYSFVWEEHVTYFTEATLIRLVQQSGYKLLNLLRFEGQLEDALVALVQPLPYSEAAAPLTQTKESRLFAPYAEAFSSIRKAWHQALSTVRDQGGRVAVFGAGHQAIMFINALGLQEYISYLVDDDVNKQAYLTPGSHLPIVSSAKMLADDKIDTCLLAVSPRIESKIQEKCAALLERGGKMVSIFPGSPLYQFREEEEVA